MEVVDLGGSNIAVLPVVRGLVSEGNKVRETIDRWTPSSVALSISKEEVQTLKKMEKDEANLETFEEEFYVRNLSEFGDVKKPPPCFVAAVKHCAENGVECVGADMTEDEYTDAYCHFVSTMEMMRDSWSKNRLRAKMVNVNSPEEFVLRFDEIVNKTQGHRDLEREREKVMAHRIRMLAKTQDRILAVIELERSEGVLTELKKKRG
jgi:hypothetical protein